MGNSDIWCEIFLSMEYSEANCIRTGSFLSWFSLTVGLINILKLINALHCLVFHNSLQKHCEKLMFLSWHDQWNNKIPLSRPVLKCICQCWNPQLCFEIAWLIIHYVFIVIIIIFHYHCLGVAPFSLSSLSYSIIVEDVTLVKDITLVAEDGSW